MKFDIVVSPVLPAGHVGPAPKTLVLEGNGVTALLALADAFDRAASESIASAGRHAQQEA